MHRLKTARDCVTREVLYIILIESEVPMKSVRLIKMYLNETYSYVRKCKQLSHKEWCLLGCDAVWLL
jgi:hypothetical protein